MKYLNFTKFNLCFMLCLMIFISGCNFQSGSTNNPGEKETVSFVTWNTQTFFDGITDGYEYSDFQKEKNWNKDKYLVRLERLCQVMETLNADIFVLQEIENEAVMRDISNMMAKNAWDKKKQWPYATFAKNEGDAMGCGMFSRFPISKVESHSLDIRTEDTEQPPMRPIVKVDIKINDRILPIFINHWKSKYGGQETSEKWRNWQESVLCHCISILTENNQNKNFFCIAAGDFNKDITEFSSIENEAGGKDIIFSDKLLANKTITAYSPWFTNNLTNNLENNEPNTKTENYISEIGSYFYKDSWEKIDNIFSFGNITISDFSPQATAPWVNEHGIPIKYQHFTGQGYSDHLPLMCNLTF